MRSSMKVAAWGGALLLALSAPTAAQQSAAPAGKAQAKGSKAAPAATPEKPSTGGDSALRSRVEQLEEQLVDLQVTIGTLESLARNAGGASPAAAASRAPIGGGDGGAVASRVDGLEIQLRALVAQVEQLTDQVRTLNARRSSAPDQGETRMAAVPAAPSAPPLRPSAPAEPRAPGGFGSMTVTPGGGNDPIGGLIGEDQPKPTPAAVPAGDGGNPKQLYETAYGYLLQQNYGAAETAFEDFLARHPGDGLAGNAQYWLGESHFVRGQYKQAAGAFLKGYQTYSRSAKAPDSLLKLAMSLDRLGQKEAACTSYGELNTRFPNAPQNIRARAESERRRIGCP